MNPATVKFALDNELPDAEIVSRIRRGETGLFEVLMRRYNQRLFRVVLAILNDPVEAEDVMQDAYISAYSHLEQFQGRAKFATWLTKIAVHEAIKRVRKRKRALPLTEGMVQVVGDELLPEAATNRKRMLEFLSRELDRLPAHQRLIFTLRDLEEFSTGETAVCLGITEQNVKVTLHRARNHLRQQLQSRLGISLRDLHTFGGRSCDNVVRRVLKAVRGSA